MQSENSPQQGPDSIISFEKVDYSHRNGVPALRDVNLQISSGELVAILGANGAGKSTLVRHINGLLKPTHGKVTVYGQDTHSVTPATLSRKVGIVFQNPDNQLFAQTVAKEIEFGLTNFGFSRESIEERVKWALDTFSLSDYAERSPIELSGGEKKRLCIALVLAWDPSLLILDEPTVGQDYEQKERLARIIRELLVQKKNVILVTHDVEFIWPLQPRTVLMSNGTIIADASAQVVLGNPELAKNSSVIVPQLVDLSIRSGWIEPYPSMTEEAEKRIVKGD